MASEEKTDTRKYVTSQLFDKKLMELGGWPEATYSELEEWNESTDYEAQRARAALLISDWVLKILGNDCSSGGKMRARRLGRSLADLEQIIISTRGLERKFYRDHLNHVIRVALLARAIGKRSLLYTPTKDLDKVVLVSLFHDVAYPLSEIGQSIKLSAKAIKNCYNIASKALLTPDIRFDLSILSGLPLKLREREKKLAQLDHGILSALEFASYLQPRKELMMKYKEAIKAIALHNSSDRNQIDSSRDRILSVLILADELQDWGRPIGNRTEFSFIPKIEKFKLDNSRLKGLYDTKNIKGYSVLRQIYAKKTSLGRIHLPQDFDFTLKFSFDHFEDFNIHEIESSLQRLFNKCCDLEDSLFDPSNFPRLYEEESVFEKEYYGRSIPSKTKVGLFRLLDTNKLIPKSVFRGHQLLFSENIKELLISNVKMGSIKHFQFQSSLGSVELQSVTKSAGTFSGEIEQMDDHQVFFLAMSLLSEIRFLNICVQKIARFRSKKYPVQIGFEGFPKSKDALKAAKAFKEAKLPRYFELLTKLRDCISSDGVFIFRSRQS